MLPSCQSQLALWDVWCRHHMPISRIIPLWQLVLRVAIVRLYHLQDQDLQDHEGDIVPPWWSAQVKQVLLRFNVDHMIDIATYDCITLSCKWHRKPCFSCLCPSSTYNSVEPKNWQVVNSRWMARAATMLLPSYDHHLASVVTCSRHTSSCPPYTNTLVHLVTLCRTPNDAG